MNLGQAIYTMVLSVVLSAGVLSCREQTEVRVVEYMRDGQIDQARMVEDVEHQLTTLSQGISGNDADKIFSIFSTTHPTVYVRNGEIEESVDAARQSYRRSLSQLKNKRKFAFERKEFDVLGPRSVLFNGIGVISSPDMKSPWRIAYTIVFSLESAGWRAVTMHISWENQKG